ncbi:hypothetical protein AQUCO_00100257v1 [Aquilegia coerulea]|uniref:Uncharacterized protein n=1 Tax=Aquilegia coerulea TaxID=218851 RepID=A0A2G5F9M0_AQUCA|nr:hypothetical protein AQUCO_00100257v1 [Aquilegia coerulea]
MKANPYYFNTWFSFYSRVSLYVYVSAGWPPNLWITSHMSNDVNTEPNIVFSIELVQSPFIVGYLISKQRSTDQRLCSQGQLHR